MQKLSTRLCLSFVTGTALQHYMTVLTTHQQDTPNVKHIWS